MLFITDINWLPHVLVALLVGTAITLLFFLRSSPKARVLPSVMLWLQVAPQHSHRKLGGVLSRLLHLLVLLLALVLLTCGLLGVNVRSPQERQTVVVADPRAVSEAVAFYRSLPVQSRSLIISQAQPRHADQKAAYEDWQATGNSSEAMLLAAQTGAKVLYFGPSAPAWLPADGEWVTCGQKGKAASAPELTVFSPRPPESGYDGWQWVTDRAQADLTVEPNTDEQSLLELTEPLQGTYADGFQHVATEGVSVPDTGFAVGLEDVLWLCGLVLVMAELCCWLRRKVL